MANRFKSSLQNINNNLTKGFTLVELSIVLFFLVLLLGVFSALFVWHSSVYYYQMSLVRVSEQGRNSISAIQGSVNQANKVLTTTIILGTTYNSSTTTLAVQIPSIDSSNNALSGKWDNAVFTLSGQNLLEIVSPDASSIRKNIKKTLADSVQALSFTYNKANIASSTEVSVSLLSQLTYKGHVITNNLQQNMYLNNFY